MSELEYAPRKHGRPFSKLCLWALVLVVCAPLVIPAVLRAGMAGWLRFEDLKNWMLGGVLVMGGVAGLLASAGLIQSRQRGYDWWSRYIGWCAMAGAAILMTAAIWTWFA